VHVLQAFDDTLYDPAVIRAHALKFDSEVFRKEITEYVDRAWENRFERG